MQRIFGPHSHSDSLSESDKKIGLIRRFAFLDLFRILHFWIRISDYINIFEGFCKIIKNFDYSKKIFE